MINVEYTITPQESANATLDFLINRPVMALIFKFMKYSCILLCIGFAITLYNKQARVQDFVSVMFAVLWIIFYRPVNRWVIKGSLGKHKFPNAKQLIKIDQKSILNKNPAGQPQHIDWKNVKFILQNKDGYIVPLTGFSNAGKFLWLPFRGFTEANMQEEFISLVNNLKLKIKKVST